MLIWRICIGLVEFALLDSFVLIDWFYLALELSRRYRGMGWDRAIFGLAAAEGDSTLGRVLV